MKGGEGIEGKTEIRGTEGKRPGEREGGRRGAKGRRKRGRRGEGKREREICKYGAPD